MPWLRLQSLRPQSLRPQPCRPNKHWSLTGLSFATALGALVFGLASTAIRPQVALASESCPAALERFRRHTTAADETLASIAATYRLFPETLTRFNPGVTGSTAAPLAAGTELIVPPFNGRVVTVSSEDSWQSLAERYSSRADVLFEVNGCVSRLPNRIFVPGATPITPIASRPSTLQLSGYPLSQTVDIALSYGWQPHPSRDELVFNGGLTFAVPAPMAVQSVGDGTVAFVGEREGYGRLLVINHEQGLQTRYANLSDISVSVGQSVSESMVVGSVGAPVDASVDDQAADDQAAQAAQSAPGDLVGDLAGDDLPASAPTYLYFEVRTNSASGWIAQDPGKYLPALELR